MDDSRNWEGRRELDGRRLKDCPAVVDLRERAPVGGQATSGRDGRLLERAAAVVENLPARPRLRDERNQPGVAAARWALDGKLLPHPGQKFRPSNRLRGVRKYSVFTRLAGPD